MLRYRSTWEFVRTREKCGEARCAAERLHPSPSDFLLLVFTHFPLFGSYYKIYCISSLWCTVPPANSPSALSSNWWSPVESGLISSNLFSEKLKIIHTIKGGLYTGGIIYYLLCVMHLSFETPALHRARAPPPPGHHRGKVGTITLYSSACVSLGGEVDTHFHFFVAWFSDGLKSSGGGNEWTT